MSRGATTRAAVYTWALVAASGVCSRAADPPYAGEDSLVVRLERQDNWRAEALREYESTRRYVVSGERFGQNASMEVRVNYVYPGRKNMQVMWQTGSRLLQTRVLRRVIEAEMEAAQDEWRDQVRISPRNYNFRPAGVANIDGRPARLFELTPKRKGKFLIRGRVWVDVEDAAVVRLEGEPLTTSSFWVRGVRIVQEYRRVGPFWMLSSTRTDADVRFFGPAHLTIEHVNYQVNRSFMAHLSGAAGSRE